VAIINDIIVGDISAAKSKKRGARENVIKQWRNQRLAVTMAYLVSVAVTIISLISDISICRLLIIL